MDRATTKLRRFIKKDKDNGSFKFTISFIVFTLTALYQISTYVKDTPITFISRIVILMLFFLLSSALIFMGFSLFIKAISLETNCDIKTKYLESFSTDFYLASLSYVYISFIMLIMTFICAVIFHPLSNIINSFLGTSDTITHLSLLMSSLISSSVGIYIMAKIVKTGIVDFALNITSKRMRFPAILSFVFIALFVFYIISCNITIEMNDVYNKHNEIIPIDIKVTGVQQNDISVNLSKVDSKSNLVLIDSIKIKSNSPVEIR